MTQDSSIVMLQTSLNGLETNYLIIGTFINNSQVLLMEVSSLIIESLEKVSLWLLSTCFTWKEEHHLIFSRSAKPH